MEAPKVSVIMTVYNGEQFLKQAIASIRGQTLTNFEFVIVDDGSTDQSPQILAEEAYNDSHIKIIYTPHIGRSKALNLAWKSSKGDQVANIDADDLSEPTRLDQQLSFFQQHPEVGLLGTAWKILEENTKYILERHPLINDTELRKGLIRKMQFYHSSMMMPRNILEKVEGYNENLSVSIDYDLCVRIASICKIANLSHMLAIQRIHDSNIFEKKPDWLRYRTHVGIRWKAWKNFTGSFTELLYVINPIGSLDQGIRKKLHRLLYYFRDYGFSL